MKKINFVNCIILAILLCGCDQSHISSSASNSVSYSCSLSPSTALESYETNVSKSYNTQMINIPFDGKLCQYYGLVGENLYFCWFDDLSFQSENKGYPVLRYNLANQELYTIGYFEQFSIAVDSQIMIDDIIYFYITTGSDNGLSNCLYAIDTVSDKLYLCNSDSGFGPFISTGVQNGNIISLKRAVPTGDSWTTHIEIFSPRNNEITHVLESTLYEKQGRCIVAMSQFDERVYVLEHLRNPSDMFFITVYDLNWNIVQEISVDNMNDFMLTNPYEMMVLGGEYICFRNFGMDYIVGKITDNSVIPIMRGGFIASANNTNNREMFSLYTRTEYMYVDPITKELIIIKIKMPNNNTVQQIIADGENLIIHIGREDGSSQWFTSNNSDVSNYNFQVS